MILSWFCLDICNKTGLLSQDFDCQVAGFAQKYVTGWPFYRSHNCAYKNAVIEVLNTSDFVPSPKWLTASTTAHEIAHLIGNTEHDGEEEFYGGGPGGGGCRGGAGQIMAPGTSIASLYRFCKDIDPWSECTIEQIKFYSDDWRQFCPGSFFTYHENPLYFYAPFYLLAALICINYAYRIYRIQQDIQHLRRSRVQESDPDHQPQLWISNLLKTKVNKCNYAKHMVLIRSFWVLAPSPLTDCLSWGVSVNPTKKGGEGR